MLETRKAAVEYIFSSWILDRNEMVLEGFGLRKAVEDRIMVWMFLTVVNDADADAGGKDRKREDYIPF